jgi:hypothetical protein
VLVEIAQLDTLATAQDQPDDNAVGAKSPGYHPNFRESRLLPPTTATEAGSPRGESARKEKVIRCLAQWEVENYDFLQQWASGNSPGHRIGLVFHYRDLKTRGLVDDDGNAKIHVNDRLCAVYHAKTKALIQEIRNPPGLYITQLEPGSMGLRGGERNILLATLEDRERSTRRA